MHLVPPYKASINMMTKPCHMRWLTPVKHLHFYFACPSAVKPNFYLQSSQFSARRGAVIEVSRANVTVRRTVHGNLSLNRKPADSAFARPELDDITGHFLLVQRSQAVLTNP